MFISITLLNHSNSTMRIIQNQYIHLLLFLLYTLQVIVEAKQDECPKSSNEVICIAVYDPVKCGDLECEYSNQCVATAASSEFTSETCNIINVRSKSAATNLNQEGSRYVLFLSLFAVMGMMFTIGDLV